MVKLMLEQHGISYLPIESVSMQERVRAVDFVLARSGLEAQPSESRLRPRAQTVPPIATGPVTTPRIENWPHFLIERNDNEA
jgi:hypothetical protein